MRYLFKAHREMFRAIRNQSLSVFGTIVTIFLATIIPGLFWIIGNNLSVVEENLREDLSIDVFLAGDPPEDEVRQIEGNLLKLEGVTRAVFYSKADALFRMRQKYGQEIIRDLDENPLPASFSLIVEDRLLKAGAADSLIDVISAMPEVEEVVFAREMFSQLSDMTGAVKGFGYIIAALVIFSGIFISANTVRIAITDRREVVSIMQIVGATRNYILTPFVLLGGLIGLSGVSLAAVALWYITGLISRTIIKVNFLNVYDIAVFILTGLLLGMVGALLATRKYLKV